MGEGQGQSKNHSEKPTFLANTSLRPISKADDGQGPAELILYTTIIVSHCNRFKQRGARGAINYAAGCFFPAFLASFTAGCIPMRQSPMSSTL